MLHPRSQRGLTGAQHQTIRRFLALIPALVWVAYVWPIFFTQLPNRSDPERGHYVRDFLHFYTQGEVVREHDRRALYDIDALARVAERSAPGVTRRYPPVYGPQVGFIFAPLTVLPYVDALYVWLFATIAGYGACVYLMTRELRSLRLVPGAVATLALGFPALHFTLSFGQASLIGLICFTAMWIAMRKDAWFTAGVAVGLLAYKPPLALVAAVVFVVRKEWRLVFGAIVTVGLQVVVSSLYWGADVWGEYGAALTRLPNYLDAMEPHPELASSIRTVISSLGLPPVAGIFATVAVSTTIAGMAAWCWRPRQSLALSYIVCVCATLLVDPHFYVYDLLVAAPALLLAWSESAAHSRRLVGVAGLAVYVAALVSAAGVAPRIPWTLIALAALMAASMRPQGTIRGGYPPVWTENTRRGALEPRT